MSLRTALAAEAQLAEGHVAMFKINTEQSTISEISGRLTASGGEGEFWYTLI